MFQLEQVQLLIIVGEMESARLLLQECKPKTIEQNDQNLSWAHWLRAMGEIENIQSKYDSALQFYQRAKEIYQCVESGASFAKVRG